MTIDGQPAGEDAVGPGAGVRLRLIVINALLQSMTHRLQVLEVLRCELRDDCILKEAFAFGEETHFLHKALHIAVGEAMLGELVVQELLVNIIGHIKFLVTLLVRIHCIIVRTNLKLGGHLEHNTKMYCLLSDGYPRTSEFATFTWATATAATATLSKKV